ncbi:anti-sigma regulatory factor [Tuberibacillus sp. Marseille-P3662]|uniref:anti-sigma regulatory factor n=1 Tax=Tuberibacillus sp. Marseille-P3662 TaxID=1965358 RepID=UPI000A1CED25|nr:anti-sigma regulatory factor [Tuberibacillus sp. Marseille-P3662]
MGTQSNIDIKNEWDIVNARQQGRYLAKELGFGHVDQARITTTISELARNIYLYAQKGTITVAAYHEAGRTGLKMVAKDDGPGINDVKKVMQDGYTTSGGLGAGLPGVKRLMDSFDLRSHQNEGTEVVAIKWLR